MQYGICHLSIVPVRSIADDASEMTSQLLYGEHYKILEKRKLWSRIRIAFDGFEGWMGNNQITLIEKEDYDQIENCNFSKYSSDLISFVETTEATLLPIVMGSSVHNTEVLPYHFEGGSIDDKREKANLVKTALLYLNAPYLWGGKTPFGIDCSGFTQMVYKINGYRLPRNAFDQVSQGDSLSFIEESEPGDLVFFDNEEGTIDHVGIIMENNYIIHAHGKIRIDRIDHTGIFNTETGNYTHALRVIKKII